MARPTPPGGSPAELCDLLPSEKHASYLQERIALRVSDEPFEPIVRHATEMSWTRDPFDRIIVAHAAARQAPLVSKDRTIRREYPAATWG